MSRKKKLTLCMYMGVVLEEGESQKGSNICKREKVQEEVEGIGNRK